MAYIDRWLRFNRARPKPRPGRWRDEVAWMSGVWSVQPRDFTESNAQLGVTLLPRGAASIAFTPDRRWLKIESHAAHRYSLRLLGYDPEARRWVWRDIFAPGVVVGPSYATAWKDGRLHFDPRWIDYHGLRGPDRLTLVRESVHRFRLVSEVRTDGRHWVAADDEVYTRP
ncbi:MAG: hypothetical protein NVSMB19_00650 [Vulcanimicrobiaceae bacterium]